MRTRTDVFGGQGETTGSFSGVVTDEGGFPLPGAVVEAVVHEPTESRYDVVTRADGRWAIRNVRVGGPYTVTATETGYKTGERTGVFVKQGEDFEIDFQLALETIEEEL